MAEHVGCTHGVKVLRNAVCDGLSPRLPELCAKQSKSAAQLRERFGSPVVNRPSSRSSAVVRAEPQRS